MDQRTNNMYRNRNGMPAMTEQRPLAAARGDEEIDLMEIISLLGMDICIRRRGE